jgi:predicted 2-oxoglutarate/Fe(II)-dependent dioxygenase YbiX
MLNQLRIFERFGLFLVRDFLDAQLCQQIQADMQASDRAYAGAIYNGEGQFRIDETIRKTQQVKVSDAVHTLMRSRLAEVKPKLEHHFQTELQDDPDASFLVYDVGGFYQRHCDRNTNLTDEKDDRLRFRRVSLVIFINGEESELQDNRYCGGALMFYPVLKSSQAQTLGLSLNGQPGLLVAFDSALPHEVQPVLAGRRFTVVSWFLEGTTKTVCHT